MFSQDNYIRPWVCVRASQEQYFLRYESRYLLAFGRAIEYMLGMAISMATQEVLKYTALSSNCPLLSTYRLILTLAWIRWIGVVILQWAAAYPAVQGILRSSTVHNSSWLVLVFNFSALKVYLTSRKYYMLFYSSGHHAATSWHKNCIDNKRWVCEATRLNPKQCRVVNSTSTACMACTFN